MKNRRHKKQKKTYNKLFERFSLDQLKLRCNRSIAESMKELGGTIHGIVNERYAFMDNGSNVLAVAHLDTVRQEKTFDWVQLAGDCWVFSPRLDDRLGVYTILDLLPKMGLKFDILLTENEETGASTASDFKTAKQYNWIVEFDRTGTDVVTYQYDWNRKILSKQFPVIQTGSFTDITSLGHLGVKGLNVGVGYHNCHETTAHFSLDEYLTNMERFIRFYNTNKEKRFEHTEKPHRYSNYLLYDYDGGNQCYYCPICCDYTEDEFTTLRDGERVCNFCNSVVYNVEDIYEEKPADPKIEATYQTKIEQVCRTKVFESRADALVWLEAQGDSLDYCFFPEDQNLPTTIRGETA